MHAYMLSHFSRVYLCILYLYKDFPGGSAVKNLPAKQGTQVQFLGKEDFTFTFHFHALEKEMATHSSILTWRIPETEETSGLPSMGLHTVGHD